MSHRALGAAECLGAGACVQAHDSGPWGGGGVWSGGLCSCPQAGWCDPGRGPEGSRRKKADGPQWWLWSWL